MDSVCDCAWALLIHHWMYSSDVMLGPSFVPLSPCLSSHMGNSVITRIPWSQPEAETAWLTHSDSKTIYCLCFKWLYNTWEWIITLKHIYVGVCSFRICSIFQDVCFLQPVKRFWIIKTQFTFGCFALISPFILAQNSFSFLWNSIYFRQNSLLCRLCNGKCSI